MLCQLSYIHRKREKDLHGFALPVKNESLREAKPRLLRFAGRYRALDNESLREAKPRLLSRRILRLALRAGSQWLPRPILLSCKIVRFGERLPGLL